MGTRRRPPQKSGAGELQETAFPFFPTGRDVQWVWGAVGGGVRPKSKLT